MNVVFIIPTGLGAEIGGHAGDAIPAAKLIASVSDRLITHPNVLNASDINEMTENMLYVEGSQLDGFLQGRHGLVEVRSNRILVVVNKPVHIDTINSVSAARATLGCEAEILELETKLTMVAGKDIDGRSTGVVTGVDELVTQVCKYGLNKFDALAVITNIDVDKDIASNYAEFGGVNPWGGVEAEASRAIAKRITKPVAHAPFGHTLDTFEMKVDPRLAAEFVSVSYMHCVMKGLHKAPQISYKGINIKDVDALVVPSGCYGIPYETAMQNNMPFIMVMGNKTIYAPVRDIKGVIEVATYMEALGVIIAIREGISIESITRPINETIIHRGYNG